MNNITKPMISVIIPTYNHARFIGKALQSVLDQTYTNWEAIVIDNHSQDNTDEVMHNFADSRIILLKIHNNGVIAASRNMGIHLAKGELIAFLDSDDSWYPQKLEHCLQIIESGYDVVCHGELSVREQNGIQQRREVYYGPQKARTSFNALLFEGNCISTSAVLVLRQQLEMVGCFDEGHELITAEDYHLWLKLARAGARIGFVHEILGESRIHSGNASKDALRNMKAVRTTFVKVYSEIAAPSLKMRIKAWRRWAIIDYSGARAFQDNAEYRKAWPWFLKSIIRWPFIPKFYASLMLNALHCRPSKGYL